jgi:hydrogenase maturation protease
MARATTSAPDPVLVIAVGNPSRGDDAIGPRLAARLEAAALPGVEVLCDFQLQVEHALDLEGRDRVVFVDAGTGTPAPCEWRRVVAGEDWRHTSHALSPEAVLATWARLRADPPPPCWVLCVRGERFELGEGLSEPAERNLEAAWPALLTWLSRPDTAAPLRCAGL